MSEQSNPIFWNILANGNIDESNVKYNTDSNCMVIFMPNRRNSVNLMLILL